MNPIIKANKDLYKKLQVNHYIEMQLKTKLMAAR